MSIKLPNRSLGLNGLIDWTKEIVARAILDGRLIEGVAVSTTATTINHLLGRPPRGVVVVASDVADSFQRSDFTSETFTITSGSGAAVVSLWVF